MRSAAEAAPGHVYVPELAGPGSVLRLPPEESHYVARVCRARPGDAVTATDGRGSTALLRVEETRDGVLARVESVTTRPRTRRAWVLSGAPEQGRADWMVEKLAELGVERWQPVDCSRASWERAPARAERWRRLAVAALRQSRSAFLMEVATPVPFEEIPALLPEGADRLLAQEGGGPWRSAEGSAHDVCAVGPAPGFTPGELDALGRLGFRGISLAGHRLRSETAAVAWAALWAAGIPAA